VSLLAQHDWRSTARSLLRWLPGLVFTAIAFCLIAQFVDWGKFVDALAAISAWSIAFSILIYLISMAIRALAWQFLLQRRVTPSQVILALNEGYFFNNLLPFRIGELARAFLLGRRSGLGLFYVLSTIVVERSFDLAIASGLLLATLPMALKLDWARPVALIVLAVIVAGLSFLFFISRRREWIESRMEVLTSRWWVVKRWVIPQLTSILDAFGLFNRIEFFAGSLALLASSWFLAILRDWLLIRSFVPDAPLWWAALGISAANMVGAVPAVMGALGTYELGGVGALTLVGMPGEAALAYVLVVHVTHLIFSTLFGAYGLSKEGKTLSSLYNDIRRSRQM